MSKNKNPTLGTATHRHRSSVKTYIGHHVTLSRVNLGKWRHPDPCFEVQIHDKMDALLTAASVLDSTRLKEAERAEVARLPFVAQPLGQYKGPRCI